MKYLWLLGLWLLLLGATSCKGPSQEKNNEIFDIKIEDMVVRDPFVFVDRNNKSYYMQVNGGNKTLKCYKSKDLKNWKYESDAFVADSLFWGQRDFWAPDMFEYKGRYYILATFSNVGTKRGTSFLVSDKPEGLYKPLLNKPITPPEWTCLDATLYIDENDTPWLLYSREWIEVIDGQILIQQLSDDLTKTVGEPRLLFKASQASWTAPVRGKNAEGQPVEGYVTDAPVLYRASNGELLMIWSSFTRESKYAIGVARSDDGTIAGNWTVDSIPLNADDGGHAMIFRDLDNQLRISYHAPNNHPSRPQIRKLEDKDGKLRIVE